MLQKTKSEAEYVQQRQCDMIIDLLMHTLLNDIKHITIGEVQACLLYCQTESMYSLKKQTKLRIEHFSLFIPSYYSSVFP